MNRDHSGAARRYVVGGLLLQLLGVPPTNKVRRYVTPDEDVATLDRMGDTWPPDDDHLPMIDTHTRRAPEPVGISDSEH